MKKLQKEGKAFQTPIGGLQKLLHVAIRVVMMYNLWISIWSLFLFDW